MERAAYRVREVADILGMGESSIYRLIASGDLACYRLARNTVRIGTRHLAAYLERSECPANELTEAGRSNEGHGGNSGTPTDGSTDIEHGFRSALRMRARRGGRSPTSKPRLKVVGP